jgi:hypothetical protein
MVVMSALSGCVITIATTLHGVHRVQHGRGSNRERCCSRARWSSWWSWLLSRAKTDS